MNDLDALLRESARAFSADGAEVPDRLGEIRRRSAARRRTRRRAVSAVASVVAVAVVVAVLRLPGGEGSFQEFGTDGERPVTTAADPARPGTSAAVTVPGSVPGEPGSTTTTTVPGAAPTDAQVPTTAAGGPVVTTGRPAALRPGPVVPVPGSLTFSADGLGVARFGDDVDTALAALTAALGPPDVPGASSPTGRCGIGASRYVFWGNLSVTFHDRGSGLRLAGYQYGSPVTRQPPTNHVAPVESGRPVLANPWGLRLGGPVASATGLLDDVRAVHPGAELLPGVDPVDTVIAVPLSGTYRATIELHPSAGSGFLFERFTVWSAPDLVC
jgi:hypothetical protein